MFLSNQPLKKQVRFQMVQKHTQLHNVWKNSQTIFTPDAISVTLNYRHVAFGARLSRCHKVKEALCSSRYEKANLAI